MESTQNKIYEIEETTPQQFTTDKLQNQAIDQVNDPDQYGDKFEDATKHIELGHQMPQEAPNAGPGTATNQSKLGGQMGAHEGQQRIPVKT